MSELKKAGITQCVYLTKEQIKDLEEAYNRAYPKKENNSVMPGRSLGKTRRITPYGEDYDSDDDVATSNVTDAADAFECLIIGAGKNGFIDKKRE